LPKGRKEGRMEGREEGRKGEREGGRKGGREGGREGNEGKDKVSCYLYIQAPGISRVSSRQPNSIGNHKKEQLVTLLKAHVLSKEQGI
jgi:hypothetical protein